MADIQTRSAIEKELVLLIKLLDGHPAISILKTIKSAIFAGVDVDDILNALDSVLYVKGALTIHQNEDGSSQLKDDISRLWCACGKPAISYAAENDPVYKFSCKGCMEKRIV